MKKKTIKYLLCFIVFFSSLKDIYSQQINPIFSFIEIGGGALIANQNNKDFGNAHFIFNNSPSIYTTEHFGLGFGFSIMTYSLNKRLAELSQGNDIVFNIPIYIHGMYIFPGYKKYYTYILLKAGYGILSKEVEITESQSQEAREYKYSGGRYLGNSIGVFYNFNRDHKISISLYCNIMNYHLNINATESIKRDNTAVSINIGWLLN